MATFTPHGAAAAAANTRISITRCSSQLPVTQWWMALGSWSKMLEVPHSHHVLLWVNQELLI